jgi:shikimate dehydrogenase
LALKKAEASEIILSNRTKEKAENLKKKYSYLKVVNWGDVPDSNMIINATSLGLKEDDEIKLNYTDIGPNKLFYDIIYNPSETKFLSKAKQFGNQIENGKMMFAYQAQLAFEIWHGIKPAVDKKILKLLDND